MEFFSVAYKLLQDITSFLTSTDVIFLFSQYAAPTLASFYFLEYFKLHSASGH